MQLMHLSSVLTSQNAPPPPKKKSIPELVKTLPLKRPNLITGTNRQKPDQVLQKRWGREL